MNKFFTLLLLGVTIVVAARAQTAAVPSTQPYGKVDRADLELKECDFEKSANAEILFDKGKIVPDTKTNYVDAFFNMSDNIHEGDLVLERHVRIKIFNEMGKKEASIRFEYNTRTAGVSTVTDLQAETINLENDKIEITPLDKKLIYNTKVDRGYSVISFAMPNVKPGSVIEFKYTQILGLYSTWYFQNNLPTRYSEIQAEIPNSITVRAIPTVSQPFVENIGKGTDYKQIRALANIPSLPNEIYMSARQDNLQRIEYLGMPPLLRSWPDIGNALCRIPYFGGQFDVSLKGDGVIIKQAKKLKSDDEKIAFIFNEVKNSMKWDGVSRFYTFTGTFDAWNTKTGNSAEINLILYHLLKESGIKAYPMVISTKDNGKLNPASPNAFIVNSTIVYVPVDSTKNYVLDATNKFNVYNEVPVDELDSFGLSIDKDDKNHRLVYLQKENPVMQSILLNAEIKPEGQMTGTAKITSYSYNKMLATKKYQTDGEEKYIDYLRNDDNNIKISSIKLENMDTDSLPLSQKVDFDMTLSGSDKDYIYLNTNLFTSMNKNPFLNETRFSDIDFGYRDNFALYGVYKLPAGYKTEGLPKTITIVMPDKSITFKRTTAEADGNILIKYVLNHEKTIYFKEDYQDIRGFYKKMYELLNEQIVLKKI